ncbi:hypothetical protein C1I98_18605 [Spongiactinospora gelatinilytica]|uniref:Uncharacterized protein n=1 Tax=Spongiactinospora gelatinilytica TaxID=2666298 RepID=A0A2W2G064_9ACTN|nr:hypothetical protein C1I98_18605 [Spongiactinospora gelatinilytica]
MAVMAYAGGGAKAGDELHVSPRSVGKGGVATVTMGCSDYANAYVTSDAFGRVDFNGQPSVDVTVSAAPGRYRVKGMCEADGQWEPGDAWLNVGGGHGGYGGPGDRFRSLFGLGDYGGGHHGHHGHHGGYGGHGDYDDDYGDYEDDDYDHWPDYGPATGGGATAMRPVSPAMSVGVGIGVVAAVAGLLALVRLGRRRVTDRRG